MEFDEPVHEGFLLLPPSGKGKLSIKKSWQKKYCLLYKRSSSGIARMEIYEADSKTGPAKIITLEDVIKITPKPSGFSILTKSSDCEFETLTDDVLNVWFRAVQNVAFPDELSLLTSIEEDNDLYCSTDEGVFYVKLHPSDASKRCHLANKNYTLVVTSTAIQLRSENEGKLLYTWPYCYIRRYGYKHGLFTFEAGRKCASGEGTFFLEHPNEHEIYRCLSSKMKNMKKLLKNESTSSILNCSDAQLHAAISMEARSRSPLPPSPVAFHPRSGQTSFNDSSRSLFPLSMTSLENMNIVKPIPEKPPRKSLSLLNPSNMLISAISEGSDPDYQDVNPSDEASDHKHDGYDSVENRKEAWRTMGVEDPSHTEQSPSDPEEDYVSWGKDILTKSVSKVKLTLEKHHAPAVITEPRSDGEYYDRLNFFGSCSRLNISSDYKQVLPSPLLPSVTTPPSVNFYDEVEVMKPARSADDSHLGYALVRKDAASGTLKQVESDATLNKVSSSIELNKELEEVCHQFHNDEAYAVISKPKRV